VSGMELIPCPTCSQVAEVVTVPFDAMSHSRCVKGHDNTLIPSVLRHLRSLAEGAEPKSA
jgi:hypothetical protein